MKLRARVYSPENGLQVTEEEVPDGTEAIEIECVVTANAHGANVRLSSKFIIVARATHTTTGEKP